MTALKETNEQNETDPIEVLFDRIKLDQGLLSLIKKMTEDDRKHFLGLFKEIVEDEVTFVLSMMDYPYAKQLMEQRNNGIATLH